MNYLILRSRQLTNNFGIDYNSILLTLLILIVYFSYYFMMLVTMVGPWCAGVGTPGPGLVMGFLITFVNFILLTFKFLIYSATI